MSFKIISIYWPAWNLKSNWEGNFNFKIIVSLIRSIKLTFEGNTRIDKLLSKLGISSSISLSAYAFGYGCGFVKDDRDEAKGVQNMSLDDLTNIALKNELGGVEIPVDKYFKNKNILKRVKKKTKYLCQYLATTYIYFYNK